MTISEAAISDLLEFMDEMLGGRTRACFQDFVRSNWVKGTYARRSDSDFKAVIHELATLYESGQFEIEPCYRPDQLKASNTTIYNNEYAIRLVKDSPDPAPFDQPMSDYNIEPHYHYVDSIIIVASEPKTNAGHFFLHRQESGGSIVASVPLDFGNIICFPQYVNHTFKPSDTGLMTLNMTDRLIVPQTPEFGSDAPISLDDFPLVLVQPRN